MRFTGQEISASPDSPHRRRWKFSIAICFPECSLKSFAASKVPRTAPRLRFMKSIAFLPDGSRCDEFGFKAAITMNLQKSKSVAMLLMLAASALATPQAAAPRPSPDLVITAPSGQTTPLSSFKGKVVVLEFFFLRRSEERR